MNPPPEDATLRELRRCTHPTPPPSDLQNVIAFSLYVEGGTVSAGWSSRYGAGALANAKLVENTFPGWRLRFYHDGSVPPRCSQCCAQPLPPSSSSM